MRSKILINGTVDQYKQRLLAKRVHPTKNKEPIALATKSIQ